MLLSLTAISWSKQLSQEAHWRVLMVWLGSSLLIICVWEAARKNNQCLKCHPLKSSLSGCFIWRSHGFALIISIRSSEFSGQCYSDRMLTSFSDTLLFPRCHIVTVSRCNFKWTRPDKILVYQIMTTPYLIRYLSGFKGQHVFWQQWESNYVGPGWKYNFFVPSIYFCLRTEMHLCRITILQSDQKVILRFATFALSFGT